MALAQQAEAAGAGAASALGRACEAKGDLAAAEAAYRAALLDPAQKVAATLGLARTLQRAGRPAEALPLLREMVENQPGVLAAYKQSARTYLALDQPEEALAEATLADAMAEQDAEARQLRDECAVAKAVRQAAHGQGSLAQQDLQRLIGATPSSAALLVGLGRVHILQRQAQPALEALAKAIELQPGLAEAHFQSGYVQHMLKRDAAAALPRYQQAVQLEPANLEYRTQLGGVLVALGQSEPAIKELSQVTGSPGYGKAEGFMYMGMAQLAAKRYADALQALRQAAALAPDNVQVETFLAWACFGQKDSAGFLEHGRKAKALGQQDATLLQYLGRVEKGEPIK
jgi:tetratricopeptide (TPR) repeat protein